jgi:hypothetical protein
MGIPAQIFKHLLGACKGRFGVNDPLFFLNRSNKLPKFRTIGKRCRLAGKL